MDKKSLIFVALGQLLGAASLAVTWMSNKHQEKLMGDFIDKKFEEHENSKEKEEEES